MKPSAKAPVAESSKPPQKPRRNDDRNTKNGRGGRAPARDGKREFDRRSGTGRGKEIKKGGGGARNWGSDKNEARTAEGPVVGGEEKPAQTEGDVDAAPAPAAELVDCVDAVPEPEDNTISFEDYQKNKEAPSNELLKPKEVRAVENDFAGLHAKKFEETDFLVMGGAKQPRKREKTKEKKSLDVNIKIASSDQGEDRRRDYDSGRGSGRGRGRGNRDGGSGKCGTQILMLFCQSSFQPLT